MLDRPAEAWDGTAWSWWGVLDWCVADPQSGRAVL